MVPVLELRSKLARLLRVISAYLAADAYQVFGSTAALRTGPDGGRRCGSPKEARRLAIGGPSTARPLPSPQDAGGLPGCPAGVWPTCCSLNRIGSRPKAWR